MKSLLMAAMVALLCVALAPPSNSEMPGKGVIYGDRINIRSAPDLSSKVIATAACGQIVTVLEKTAKRKAIEADDPFGYFWYRIDAVQGKRGWIYGRYLYLMGASPCEFVEKGSQWLVGRKFTIRGRQYQFAIAVEPSAPLFNEYGLTNSRINAMPLLVSSSQAYPFSMRLMKSMIIYREHYDPWLRLWSDSGVMEKVASVDFAVQGKNPSLIITVNFTKQTGHGKYSLSVVPDGGGFAVSSYTLLEDVEDW
ncbi:MAG: SH3 domain-containing protein [Spirochaetes bacterium]|nr:SH3 domain-containing protein [Spirochaetota bacterium]